MNKELGKLIDTLMEMWLDRLLFIKEKGLEEEYQKWKASVANGENKNVKTEPS